MDIDSFEGRLTSSGFAKLLGAQVQICNHKLNEFRSPGELTLLSKPIMVFANEVDLARMWFKSIPWDLYVQRR